MAIGRAVVLLASPGAAFGTRDQPERELDRFQGPVHGAEQVGADRADVDLALQLGGERGHRLVGVVASPVEPAVGGMLDPVAQRAEQRRGGQGGCRDRYR